MHILIIGAAGMIGRKLTERLVRDGELNGQPIDKLTLVDVVTPAKPAGFAGKVEARSADISDTAEARKAIAGAAGRDLPSGGDRFRRGGARFRQGLPHQLARHAAACWK